MRPQRGSRAMSTMGENTQGMPSARASTAAGVRHDLRRRRIETGRHRQRDGEHGVVAVDHVEPEDQRNMQPRLLHGDVLIVVGRVRAHHVEKRAHLALGHHVVEFVIGGGRVGPVANPAENCTSWPIFSSRVIFLSSASTRAFSGLAASCGLGRRGVLGEDREQG